MTIFILRLAVAVVAVVLVGWILACALPQMFDRLASTPDCSKIASLLPRHSCTVVIPRPDRRHGAPDVVLDGI